MKSFAGPYALGITTKRPPSCTCGDSWRLDYELNQYADSGIDSVDWHADDCGFWTRRIAREDFGVAS